jgi:hypothetical protein
MLTISAGINEAYSSENVSESFHDYHSLLFSVHLKHELDAPSNELSEFFLGSAYTIPEVQYRHGLTNFCAIVPSSPSWNEPLI